MTTLNSEISESFGSSSVIDSFTNFVRNLFEGVSRNMAYAGILSGLFFSFSQIFGFIGLASASSFFLSLSYYGLILILLSGQFLLVPVFASYLTIFLVRRKKIGFGNFIPTISFTA